MDPALQLWSHQCHVEGQDHLPEGSSKTPPAIAPISLIFSATRSYCCSESAWCPPAVLDPFLRSYFPAASPHCAPFLPTYRTSRFPVPGDPAHPFLPLDGSTTYCCIGIYSNWARQAGQAQRSWPGPTGSTDDQAKFPG